VLLIQTLQAVSYLSQTWQKAATSAIPSQPHSVTALWPVPNYTAWQHRHDVWKACQLQRNII